MTIQEKQDAATLRFIMDHAEKQLAHWTNVYNSIEGANCGAKLEAAEQIDSWRRASMYAYKRLTP